MEKCHRANVLVNSCLKTPVDPRTKAPLAQYERERSLPRAPEGLTGNPDYEREIEYDSGSDLDVDPPTKDANPVLIKDYSVPGDNIDFKQLYFSNQEYYHKLEQLKKAHLQTIAELELMYRKKLQLNDQTHRSHRERSSPMFTGSLKKAQSALELRRNSNLSDVSVEERIADVDQEDQSNYNAEKGPILSPKEHIKNMWQDFRVQPLSIPQQPPFSSSLQSLPQDYQATNKPSGKVRGQQKKRNQAEDEGWHPRVTVPQPFQMTCREAEQRKNGVKSRSEIERENEDLRRQLEEITECQRKFRAGPVPAHVRLPLYEELHQKYKEHRRLHRETEQQRLHASQRPFSFLERERLKKEQKEAELREQMLILDKEEEERRKRPFRAKPVPRAVKEAALGEQQKEEELYRAIKMQMRAEELLHSASMPPSMLARRISERQAHKAAQEDKQVCRPKIITEVPDFDASYRRFQKQLEKRKDVRPLTACEPFKLRTATIASHKERIMADIEAGKQSPRPTRWPFVSTPALSPSSSLCSSVSGSQEYLSAKFTDAAKKRQEAVRKVIEQRKKAEEEDEKWKEKQKQRERKLQRVISKRAQANDPHVALAQTSQCKLKEFRKQDIQRRREYQEEMKGMQERVKGRPLLLEQVAQMNAKRAAEKLYSDTLHGCGLNESFVSKKAPKGLKPRQGTPSPAFSDSQTPPTFRNEYHVEYGNLQDSLHDDDYPDDYEEYDHEVEEDRDEDDKPNEYHDSDDEKRDDTEQSFDDELNVDEEQEDHDDIISKRSQSSKGSDSNNSHHSNRSRSGSIGS